ncbi:MAG: type I-E CRISPR-associated protein Cas6/Cse3/CasE [Ignavibacteriales bacterium]|nr:type I-E CRISPR-associated protein Cas6/Cse3/CasE [Ignavibacteriales bacterium]MCF8315327.1 type I-E CRISPR-associated protein Cas6/Cse3/CasE [Ignavibacteriales bacterium]MCF8436781.1 type I-E CRISPR-associated protein Cas6/Cse3/CasE [Ignavibacteriales bacterium]
MFISRIDLDKRNKRALSEINSPYEMHRTFSKAYNYTDNIPGRILFRVEPGDTRKATVLVQSIDKPDWQLLSVDESYYFNNSSPIIKEYNPLFHAGQRLIFRLRANPTKRESASRKRKGINDEVQLIQWLERKAEGAGFEIVTLEIRKEKLASSKIKDGALQHKAHLHSVLFQGELKVNNPILIADAISNGIGSGKGLGFGLLSVAAVAE